jgi:hypothetical protein
MPNRVAPPSYTLRSSLATLPSVPALDCLLLRLQPVLREPPHREHQLAVGDDVLHPGAAVTERLSGQVTAVLVQQLENHEDRRRGDSLRVRLPQPVEPGPELAVEDGHLAIEYERSAWQRGNRNGEFWGSAAYVTILQRPWRSGNPGRSTRCRRRRPPAGRGDHGAARRSVAALLVQQVEGPQQRAAWPGECDGATLKLPPIGPVCLARLASSPTASGLASRS